MNDVLIRLTRDLDTSNMRKLPGDCIDSSLREIHVDSAWGVEYLPGRRQRSGMAVLMIEVLSHPYPGVVRLPEAQGAFRTMQDGSPG